MKMYFRRIIAIIICVTVLVSLGSKVDVTAAEVTINKSKVTLEKDGYINLKLVGTSEKVKWSSKNKKIAKVSSKGKVTAVSEGTTTITGILAGKKYNCTVNVVDSNKTEEVKEKVTTGSTTIKEQKLYSKNGITITAKEFEKNKRDYYVVKLLIENNSGNTVKINVENVTINKYSFKYSESVTLYDGKKVTLDIGAEEKDLNIAGVAHVMEIGAEIKMIDPDTKDKIDTAQINVHTSDYGKYEQNYKFTGTEVYNRDGIQIIAAKDSNPSMEHPFIIYVHNSTDRKVSISYQDIAYNDELVYTFYSGFQIAPDSYAVSRAYFPKISDVEVATVKSVDFTTVILPFRLDGGFSTGDMIYADPVSIIY